MVGHQHIGMDNAGTFDGILSQPVEVKTVILIGKKTGLTIIPSLNYMQRDTGQNKTRATWHKRKMAMKMEY